MKKQNPKSLSPTLWRTCRVLANRTRLRILKHIMSKPGITVSDIARSEHIPMSVASEYLRALNARGLLQPERRGKQVLYWAAHNLSLPETRILLDVLRSVFRRKPTPFDAIFRAFTAFTHPRRIALIQAVALGANHVEVLIRMTRISRIALLRHMAKLRSRECIVWTNGGYQCGRPSEPLMRTLMALALHSR